MFDRATITLGIGPHSSSAYFYHFYTRDGTGSPPGHESPGYRVSDFGRVGSGHGSVCQTRCLHPMFYRASRFNMHVYRGVVSIQSNVISAN